MVRTENVEKTFQRILKDLEGVNQVLAGLLPQAIIREVTTFGNSSHVVLSKDMLDKKVGVIILGERGTQ